MSKSGKVSLLFFLIFLIGIIGIILYVNKTLNKNSLKEYPIQPTLLADLKPTPLQEFATPFYPAD